MQLFDCKYNFIFSQTKRKRKFWQKNQKSRLSIIFLISEGLIFSFSDLIYRK